MSIQENWHANLLALIQQEGGGDKRRGYQVVAARAGLSEEYVYQLAERKPRASGEPREIGKQAARKIAAAYANGRPDSWFDQPASASPAASNTRADEFTILQYEDRGGAMGNGGLVLEDQPPGYIRAWRVDHEWLRLNVRHHTGVHNLRIVTGFGPSMRPLYNPGDPLICDTGHNKVDVDGVYFFRVGEHGFIKILQRIPMADGIGIRAKSKNPDYDPFDITPKQLAQEGYFEVFGKILTAWKSEVL